MNVESKNSAAVREVVLDGELTIERAREIQELLQAALGGSHKVVIKIGAVQALDLTCLQLICSAHRTALGQGQDLALDGGESELFGRIRAQSGFVRHQGCSLNPTGTCLWCN